MVLRIELLDGHAGRDRFDCGETTLNQFLSRQAGQQQRKDFGKTYLALAEEGGIAGFVTLSVEQVATIDLPAQRKLPRYPVPILRIGRLAVDKCFQGRGIGRDLLAFALHLALDFSERVGLYAVVVEAKDERAAAFYRRLGFHPMLDNGLCLYLSLSVLRQTKT
jgi:GNAT superfamily N-acetyltransferase